ncbi:hypothetical protein MBANPS3_012281 [Mucor bainieri]
MASASDDYEIENQVRNYMIITEHMQKNRFLRTHQTTGIYDVDMDHTDNSNESSAEALTKPRTKNGALKKNYTDYQLAAFAGLLIEVHSVAAAVNMTEAGDSGLGIYISTAYVFASLYRTYNNCIPEKNKKGPNTKINLQPYLPLFARLLKFSLKLKRNQRFLRKTKSALMAIEDRHFYERLLWRALKKKLLPPRNSRFTVVYSTFYK